jgi:hypothetical protein
MLRHITEVHAESAIPDDLTAVQVDGNKAFLSVRGIAANRQQVEAIAEDHGSGSTANRDAPGQVLAFG